jgi:hypothetical protein
MGQVQEAQKSFVFETLRPSEERKSYEINWSGSRPPQRQA